MADNESTLSVTLSVTDMLILECCLTLQSLLSGSERTKRIANKVKRQLRRQLVDAPKDDGETHIGVDAEERR